jgi:glycerol-3-phosphate dehydrogenase
MELGSRLEHLQTLARGVDVLIIGGGITGAGVAVDAASRRYAVGLIEQADFAGATSSRSTKLVHGGIRYLPQGHISLVREGLRERTLLLRLAPHVVHPLRFVIPLYAGVRRPLGVRVPSFLRPFAPAGIRAGLVAYDLFAGDPALRHRAWSREQVEREAPSLRTDGLRAALVYHDARTDDVRLTHSALATARAGGALTANYVAARGLLRSGARVTGVRAEDRLTGRTIEIPARFVVNATGIWGDGVAALDQPPPFRVRHSKGTHLVLREGSVDVRTAIVIPETDDGRLAFIVPWAGRPLLGTTDEPYDGDLSRPHATAGDVAYLLSHANRYLRRPLEPGDVTAAWAGIRPLVAAAGGATTSAVSRDFTVDVSPGGLISVAGGKLTSYRRMAEDTVNAIVERDGGGRSCATRTLRLAGADGLDETRTALAGSALAADQQTRLIECYGSKARDLLALTGAEPSLADRLAPGLAMTAAEVVYACRAEQAVTLADCMFLRVRLAAVDLDAAAKARDRVAGLMARELGWNAAELRRQHEAYDAELDHERGWLGGSSYLLAASADRSRSG